MGCGRVPRRKGLASECLPSSIFSAELADSALAWSARAASRPWRSARSTRSVGVCWRSIGRECRSMKMSPPLNSPEVRQMLSAEDSPARILAEPVTKSESRESAADCGLNTVEQFATLDPATSSWRTSQTCLLEGWESFSATWPRSGTMRNGTVFLRPPLVPRISVTGFGYLPTPDRSMGEMHGGMTHDADLMTCFRKETTGLRPSGARIGSSLRWCPEYIREMQRTGGDVNPEWIEVLMGFPTTWTEIAPSEIQSSRPSRRSSAKRSSKLKGSPTSAEQTATPPASTPVDPAQSQQNPSA